MADECVRWGGRWRSRDTECLIFRERMPVLFRTRAEARAWIKQEFGYIRARKDLRAAPHFWRMPRAVRVVIREHPNG